VDADGAAGTTRLVADGRLVAVAELRAGRLAPVVVLPA
jgi:hypothetical protein